MPVPVRPRLPAVVILAENPYFMGISAIIMLTKRLYKVVQPYFMGFFESLPLTGILLRLIFYRFSIFVNSA